MPPVQRTGEIPDLGGVAWRLEWDKLELVIFAHRLRGKTVDIIRIILAILLPPVGVFLQVGIGLHFWINIVLTLLGYIPGIVHAVWIIAKK